MPNLKTPQPVLIHQALAIVATGIVWLIARFGAHATTAQVMPVLYACGPVFSMLAAYIAHTKVRPITDIEAAASKLAKVLDGLSTPEIGTMLATVAPAVVQELAAQVKPPVIATFTTVTSGGG